MSAKQWVLLGLVGLVVVPVVLHFWPSDRREIRRTFELMEQAGSMQAAEPSIEGLVKAGKIAGRFHDPSFLLVEEAGFEGELARRQISERIAAVRAHYSRLEVRFADLAIEKRTPAQALVHTTLHIQGQISGESVADVRELEAELVKVEGAWLIVSLRLVQVLQR